MYCMNNIFRKNINLIQYEYKTLESKISHSFVNYIISRDAHNEKERERERENIPKN